MGTTLPIGSNHRRTARAFTLIELSVVVFILMLMLALCAPQFVRSYNSASLSEAVRTFSTMSQLARMHAVTRQQKTVMHVDLDRQAFWVTQSGVDETGHSGTSLRSYQLSTRVTLVSVERPDSGERISKTADATFYPNGTCDSITVVFRGADRSGLAATIDPVTCKAVSYAVK